jgi:predicted RNA-binding protein with PUA-like domain
VRALPRFLSLAELKQERRLAAMGLVQRGNRLSVQPVLPKEWRLVLQLGGIEDPEEIL